MRIKFALALALFSTAALPAYTSLVVLGDSLSDIGNGHLITDGAVPGTSSRRASNGPVAVEYLAARLGIADFAPSELGGTGYAVFGAMTDTRNFSYEVDLPSGVGSIPEMASTGLQSQLAQIALRGPFDPLSTLFTLWGGANDLFLADARGEDPSLALGTAAGNLLDVVGGLLGLGARNILVVGMPDLGISPFAIEQGPEVQAGLSLLTAGFNDGVSTLLGLTRRATGANLMFFDPGVVTRAIIADPAGFGFTNVTEQCLLSVDALLNNCEGYAFLDDVHPTTEVHRLFGAGMVAALPEPAGTWFIALGALVWAGARGATRRRV